ncbi:hypothetical protein [Taklimakanibacter deserti]|uniref:hypothetical protein n=1 Tax=Taklimakanibacter deserti TaxID=2267839 RepID=UPI0013C53447
MLPAVCQNKKSPASVSADEAPGLLPGVWQKLLPFGPLIQAGRSEHVGDIIDMKTIDHAGIVGRRLNDRNRPVAVIIAGHSAVQHPECNNLPAFQLYDLVAVLGLAAISVVHLNFLLWLNLLKALSTNVALDRLDRLLLRPRHHVDLGIGEAQSGAALLRPLLAPGSSPDDRRAVVHSNANDADDPALRVGA